MNRTTKTLSLLTTALLSFSAHAEETIENVQINGAKTGHWTMDLDAAKKIAAEKNLPLILNFTGSDWCGWCKLMDKNVFAKEPWLQFAAENTLLVTIDFPRDKSIVPAKYVERNKALKEEFGVRGYPSYIILDSDGKTKLGKLGAGRDKTPESFISEFKNVVRMSASSIEAFAKANPGKADAYKAAIGKLKENQQALADWLATRPKRDEENNKKLAAFQESIKAAEDELAKF